MKMLFKPARIVGACVLTMSSLVAIAAAASGNKPFRITNQQADNWTVEYTPTAFQSAALSIDGTAYQQFLEGTSEDGSPGSPQLPIESISLGIPAGASLTVELVGSLFQDIPNQLIAPAAEYIYNETHDRVTVYHKNPVFYSQDRYFPSRQLSVATPYLLRQQRIGTIRIMPYQYNPVSRVLHRLLRATIKIHLVSTDGKPVDTSPTPVQSADPFFEKEYKTLISNYDQAKQWRQPVLLTVMDNPSDSTRDWFETGRTYYRINIASDGWYRVTTADLAAAGANTSTIDVSSLRVYGKGIEIPIVVRPDTTVEFYAIHNYGDSTFVDTFTDTSAYFLTWGGSPGLRFASTPQPGGTIGATVISTKVTRHFEQNGGYYYGATDAEASSNDVVPGEGWAWGDPSQWFFPNTTLDFPFVLDTIDVSGGPTARIRVRTFGTTSVNLPGPDHDARFWINDTLVGEIWFEPRTEGRLDTTLPASLLSRSASSLRIMSVPTATIPNQFYLDWFEIDYQRFLWAVNNQLCFTSPGPTGPNPTRYIVTGFSTPQIDVFDLTRQREIVGGTVTGDSTAGFSIQFNDTSASSKNYLVVARSGAIPALPLHQKSFSDIRTNNQGADYIIITHRNFHTQAQRLAAHRQVVNGVRAKVIDVEDIYDEFNYGVMNATKLRDFLRYAYAHWPSPAPSYLLLFGDASWDFHRYLSSTTQTNYVPGYGIPTGDNWFACFSSGPDSSIVPSMIIGRIPARDSIQAQRSIDKIISYDSYTLGDWNKKCMFIAGLGFNSDQTINTQITPPPLGDIAYKVYKTTPAVIDGEHKEEMRNYIRDGLVFVNFLGHSGGRVWEVDIGDPNTLENTNGKWPFVVSVSCNVGAYAEPSNPLLAENFMLADNRGSIATWASSTEGWASAGTSLVYYFLNGLRVDSLRDLGSLTNSARIQLWQTSGNYYIYVASVKCNPLLGDPLTRLAIPLQPDLAVTPSDISTNIPVPTPNDSSLSVQVRLHNYGLVPSDSVGVSIVDTYNGRTNHIADNLRAGPTNSIDSVHVAWNATDSVGRHTLVATLDPLNVIPEVNELNNTAPADEYVYANLLAVVKPLDNMVVAPGPVNLVVTSPVGLDSIGFQYFFELDTVSTFDSPFLVQSGPVSPGPVKGEWTTPPLADGTMYFWRSRTLDNGLTGNWVVSSFSTSSTRPANPLVRWRENSRKQFTREREFQTSATDSGVTIAPNQPLQLYARSLGSRAQLSSEYYTILKLNQLTVFGLWWVTGSGFMILRVNEFNGSYEYRNYSPADQAVQADSMTRFINTTPVGNYLVMVSVFDPHGGVTESLFVALESLGSTLIRQAVYGQSWAMIGRKGHPSAVLESLTNYSAVVVLQVPNYYSFGLGSITTGGITIPTSWDSFHWRQGSNSPTTSATMEFIGVRGNGRVDTLRALPGDSADVSLAFMNPLTSGPTYSSLRFSALLSSSDALLTPVLRDWWVDFIPPADLAVSSRTIGLQEVTIQKGAQLNLPVTVYNIGFSGADSARIVVSVFDKFNKARPIASAMVDTIAVDGIKSTTIPISTNNFSRQVTLQVSVSPSKKYKDLVPDNNNAYYTFNVIGPPSSGIRLFADGAQLMDGDFVAAKPTLVVSLPKPEGGQGYKQAELFIDNKAFVTQVPGIAEKGTVFSNDDDLSFSPELSNGHHDLNFRAIQITSLGVADTLSQALTVEVKDQVGIVQLYNYPNPFSSDTYFTFILTGSEAPEELTIRVFTIAGRRIREIVVPHTEMHIGFNRVHWDGRDADGDELANGYYFYQVTVKGSGKTETAIEKLVKLR